LDRFERIAALGMANMHPGGSDATRTLAEWAGVGKGVHVLDVGCGVGRTACKLGVDYHAFVTGVDKSPAMIDRAYANQARATERADRWAEERITFRVADAYDLPFRNAQFDVVLAESVTLFLDRSRVLPEFFRVLKPGGRVADVVMTCRDPVPSDVLDAFERLEGVRMEPLTESGWLDAYEAAGFEVVRKDFKPSISDGSTIWTFLQDNGAGGVAAALRMAGMWLSSPQFRAYVREGTATWNAHKHRFGFGLLLARKPE
jgi:SAM-dependent methyltransferase